MTERERWIDKIQKLLTHAASANAIGNEEEAASFAAKAQELMLRHNVELVELGEFAADDDPIEFEDALFNPGLVNFDADNDQRAAKARITWQSALAQAVAKAHDCYLITWSDSDRSKLRFIGRASNIKIARYVFLVLARTCIEIGSREYRKARDAGLPTAGFYNGFRAGFVITVRKRYAEERAALNETLRAEGHGNALVRLDDAANEVKQWAHDKWNLKDTKSSFGRGNGYAYERGTDAGKKANLRGNAVGGGRDNAQVDGGRRALKG